MKSPGTRTVAALICAGVFAVYVNSLSGGFAGDARGLVLEDPRIRDASETNLANIFTHTYWWPYGESGLYRPAATFSYLLNYSVLGSGTEPAGYHATNLLLHVLNTLLLYLVMRRFTLWAPWIALLWGVHPVLTESVAGIAGRPDLIAGACVLGGLLLYWKASETHRPVWFGALAVVTLIGALAKESAVLLPAVAGLYAWLWRRERKGAAVFWCMVAMIVPVQIMLYLRGAALFGLPPMQFPFWDNPISGAGFWTGRATALGVMARELGLWVWPARLSSDYSWAEIRPGDGALVGVAVGVVLVAGMVVLWRRSRAAFFAAASAILLWLPSSNLLFPIGAIMAERFLYLPSIALAAALVWLVMRLPSARVAYAVLALAATGFAVRTWDRNRDWANDLTLAGSAARNAPESYKSHKMLANALYESHAQIESVLAEAEKSIAILDPLGPLENNADTWRRAASWYEAKGDPESLRRARQLLERCKTIVVAQAEKARRNPLATEATDPVLVAPADVDRMIAALQVRTGDAGQAIATLARNLEQDPSDPAAWVQYADTLAATGRKDDAIVAALEGVMLTVDAGLRQHVIELYRSQNGGGCALLPGQGGTTAINPACPQVHQHMCAAASRAIGVRVKTGREDLAEQLRTTASRDLGCEMAPEARR